MSTNFWNKKGRGYKNNWEGKPEKMLSKLELNFIASHLKTINPQKALDIGCGTGRILYCLSENTNSNAEIYGIDYAQQMVDLCKKDFFQMRARSKIKGILQCDVSREDLPSDLTFDFVSAIRVLKYNKIWKDIMLKIKNAMNPGGIFVFTIPNKVSASFFSHYGVPIYLTTRSEVEKFLLSNGFILESVCSFSRLPRIFYTAFSSSAAYAKLVLFLEKVLGLFFGKTLFGKIIFFVAKKPF